MGETKNANYSLPVEKIEWVKRQKELTGKPESFFVNQGLDVVMGVANISRLKTVVIPLICFYAGALTIFFAVFFLFIIPFVLTSLLISLGLFVMVISLYATAQGIILWRVKNGKK